MLAYCKYCNVKGHSCMECPLEKKVAPYLKKIVGIQMETFVANELCCPRCNLKTLRSLGNHSPSLDVICMNCKMNYEVKSKCISDRIIPNDLTLPHGNYFDYINRQNTVNGLDFIIIIYGANRSTKIIDIRKILYIPANIAKNSDLFKVEKNYNSTSSDIYIKNYTLLNEIKMNEKISYDFTNIIKEIIESPYDHTVPIILA